MLFKTSTLIAALAALASTFAAPVDGVNSIQRRACPAETDHLVLALGVDTGVTFHTPYGPEPNFPQEGPSQRLLSFHPKNTNVRFEFRTYGPTQQQGPDGGPAKGTNSVKECSITVRGGVIPEASCGRTVELAPDGSITASWEGVEIGCN